MLFTPDISEAETIFEVGNGAAGGNIAAKLIRFTDIAVKVTADNGATCRDEKFV